MTVNIAEYMLEIYAQKKQPRKISPSIFKKNDFDIFHTY